jgi:hypothetical protein
MRGRAHEVFEEILSQRDVLNDLANHLATIRAAPSRDNGSTLVEDRHDEHEYDDVADPPKEFVDTAATGLLLGLRRLDDLEAALSAIARVVWIFGSTFWAVDHGWRRLTNAN